MQIQTRKEGSFYIISPSGDLDASSSIAFDETISQAIDNGESHILIDFIALEYISSAGLGVFVSHLEEIKLKNIELILFGLSQKVLNVFEILGIDKLLKIVSTFDDAKSILNES